MGRRGGSGSGHACDLDRCSICAADNGRLRVGLLIDGDAILGSERGSSDRRRCGGNAHPGSAVFAGSQRNICQQHARLFGALGISGVRISRTVERLRAPVGSGTPDDCGAAGQRSAWAAALCGGCGGGSCEEFSFYERPGAAEDAANFSSRVRAGVARHRQLDAAGRCPKLLNHPHNLPIDFLCTASDGGDRRMGSGDDRRAWRQRTTTHK